MTNSYISIDIETTGLNPKLDKIIEIGAIKVIEGMVTDTFETFVDPGRKLEEQVKVLTGITDYDLTNAPSIGEVMPKLIDFLEELPIVGHSILFDFSFLKKAAVYEKMCFEKKGLDTLRIARCFLQEIEHRNLKFLCEYYQIPHHAHRALSDAEATSTLYQKLCAEFYTKDSKLFLPVPLHYQVKRDNPITKAQKERLYRLLEKHTLIADYDVEKLSKSEASRYTDKILLKYGR